MLMRFLFNFRLVFVLCCELIYTRRHIFVLSCLWPQLETFLYIDPVEPEIIVNSFAFLALARLSVTTRQRPALAVRVLSTQI